MPVEHTNYDDMIHSFFRNVAEPRVERAWEAIAEIDAHLQAALGEEASAESETEEKLLVV